MDTQAIQQAIDAIESTADQAMECLKTGQVSDDLQARVKDLHQQSRSKRSIDDPAQLKQAVMDIEQSADRAMDACRKAGSVDAKLQQAIQDAHTKASALKHQVEGQAA